MISYAPGIVPQKEAMAEGYSQNLWLLGDEHALTEVSAQQRVWSETPGRHNESVCRVQTSRWLGRAGHAAFGRCRSARCHER